MVDILGSTLAAHVFGVVGNGISNAPLQLAEADKERASAHNRSDVGPRRYTATMNNPASELHSIFVKWSAANGQAAFQLRQLATLGSDESNAAFDEHIRAMRLIAECQTAIDQLEANGTKVDTFRKTLRLWAAGIMHYPYHWQQPGEATNPFDARVMDTLDTLAIVLDSRMPMVSPAGMAHLRDLLAQVKDLLVEDESLSADMRGHVYSVVQTLLRYLDDVEMYGKADIQAAIRDLWVGLNAAAGQSSDANRPKWQSFVQQIGVPAAGTILGSIPTLALEAAALVAGGYSLALLIQAGESYPRRMKDWSTEELFEGEDFFVVPEAADCFTVVPDVDGAGETSVFADSSFVRGWTPGSV